MIFGLGTHSQVFVCTKFNSEKRIKISNLFTARKSQKTHFRLIDRHARGREDSKYLLFDGRSVGVSWLYPKESNTFLHLVDGGQVFGQ